MSYPRSDHFDGQHFHNGDGPFEKRLGEVLRWMWQRPRGLWRPLAHTVAPPPVARVGEGALRVTFIGQATVLLQFDGLNLLTDPLWSNRASPLSWAGPRRYRPPALRFEDLPPIDLVVISHNHYDHMDEATLRRLQREHAPRFVTALGNAAVLRRWGLSQIFELDWGGSWALPNGRRLHAEPAQHWSGRGLNDRNRALWMSCVIETAGGPLYFAGDSGYASHFRAVRERHGPMRLALLPIGAYLPRWFMAYQHMNPAEALRAHLDLGAACSLGIHYGTFDLADDGPEQPAEDLRRALEEAGLPEDLFRPASFGLPCDIAPLSTPAARR